MNESGAPTALVSWAHRDPDWSDGQAEEWIAQVVRFATLLMSNGVETSLDLWNEIDPSVDWTRWGQLQVQNCDLVIIVASRAWRQRWEGTNSPHLGAGAVAEADTLKGLFNNDQRNFQSRTLLVLLPGMSMESAPPDLHRLQRFHIKSLDVYGMEPILRRIHGLPLHEKPVRSEKPDLPPRVYATPVSPNSEAIAVKRGELDDVKSGQEHAGPQDGLPSSGVSFDKPPLVVTEGPAGAAKARNEKPPGGSRHHIHRFGGYWFRRPQKVMTVAFSVLLVAVTVAVIASWLISISPAALARTYDGTSPLSTLCGKVAIPKDTFPIVRPGESAAFATARVMHSPRCGTTWLHVVNNLDGTTVNKHIERRAADDIPFSSYSTPNDVTADTKATPINTDSYTMQLYAPGCVFIRVEIADLSGKMVGEVPLQEVC